MAEQQHEGLDALLDEALKEFDTCLPPAAQSGAPPGSSEPARGESPEPSASSAAPSPEPPAEPQAAAAGAAGGPAARTGAGRGLAFNPLGPRPAPARRGGGGSGGAAAATTAAGATKAAAAAAQQPTQQAGSSEGVDEEALRAAAAAAGLGDLGDVDELSAGLSKLLAELANVDEETLAQAAADMAAEVAAGGRSGGAGAPQQAQRGGLASTLRALAEQAPSFGEGAGGEGADDPLRGLGAHPEMASLVDSIMQQLLSKDVLYQPMKDIGARYPAWLDAHRGTLPEEEHQRYCRQYEYIMQICALYEAEPDNYPQLVNLLQQMQQCGQPPQEIVDELAPGLQFDSEGMPRFPGTGGGAGGGAGGDLPPELAECSIM